MNLLFSSVGRRGELIKDFKKSLGDTVIVVATDNSPYAPALYLADKQYIVPLISDDNYISELLNICKKEKIEAVTTFIDPEISILAEHRDEFEKIGVEVLAPYKETADYCFDKYKMYQYLVSCGISTAPTYGTLHEFQMARSRNEIEFPVFVKPRTGSGSVGARKVCTMNELVNAVQADPGLIIQKLMIGIDMDADVYIDTITHEAVSAFTKRKIETKIGGASKTISFKDPELFAFIRKIVKHFKFNGPIDMDFFCVDGKYYLSEINPRFGGAYLHAYGAGVDFTKLIEKNVHGIANDPVFGDYEEGIVMMMYDSVVIQKKNDLTAIGLGGGIAHNIAVSPAMVRRAA